MLVLDVKSNTVIEPLDESDNFEMKKEIPIVKIYVYDFHASLWCNRGQEPDSGIAGLYSWV